MKVGTIGEVLVEFISPEKSQDFDKPGSFLGPYSSGAPAIFLNSLAKLGVQTSIISRIGKDKFGNSIKNKLIKNDVDCRSLQEDPERFTGMAFVMYLNEDERDFVYHLNTSATGNIILGNSEKELLATLDLLYISGTSLLINNTTRDKCLKATEIVKKNGGKILFDPNIRKELSSVEEIKKSLMPMLQSCDYFLPSKGEAELLTGTDNLNDAIQQLIFKGIEFIIYKNGPKGSYFFSQKQTLKVPAFNVETIDPTGAGDTFAAGFTYGLINNWSRKRTLKFANAMGALSVARRGSMEGANSVKDVLDFIKLSEKR